MKTENEKQIKKFGLVGEKLGHTFSPMIHKKILENLNIDGQYDILEFEKSQVSSIINTLKNSEYKGVNVTIPYKTDIITYLDDISDEAKKIGAVNTIHFIDNRAVGYNTDYFGFGMMLKHNSIDIENKNALILGTGGASRAVACYLADNKISTVQFLSTNKDSAKNKYADYNIYSYDDKNCLGNINIIINCTPVGMFKDKDNTPIDSKYLEKFETAIDLIYNPTETKFLMQAEKLGLKTANGLYMLVAQAVKAQKIWNDTAIDDGIIDEINQLLIRELANE